MEKRPRHRPQRKYPEAQRQIFVSEMEACIHCGGRLKLRPNWHVRKTIQTMKGPQFLAGRAKICTNPECRHCVRIPVMSSTDSGSCRPVRSEATLVETL
jgi:hypothetical protein